MEGGPAGRSRAEQGSYGLVNLFSRYQVTKDFAVQANVNNLFDKEYVGSVIVNESNGRYYEPAPGRNYGVGLSVSYRFE